MPRIKLIEERNAKIYNEYKRIYSEEFLRHERILEMLSNRYFLSEQTIGKIVFTQKKDRNHNGK